MNVMIFDTETTGIDPNKCFAYNVGYVILDIENNLTLCERDFVVEQVWHNLPLFNSAYYAEKRPLYVSSMRAQKSLLRKFGYITQQMIRDIEKYEVSSAYAYNSPFDDRVFTFNCEWYKVVNPFDSLPIFDIRGYVSEFLIDDNFKNFCEENKLFTDSGNYSGSAETVMKYVSKNLDFKEDHTALSDSKIEGVILDTCLREGGEIATEYKVIKSITRIKREPLKLVVDNVVVYEGEFTKKYIRNGTYKFTT